MFNNKNYPNIFKIQESISKIKSFIDLYNLIKEHRNIEIDQDWIYGKEVNNILSEASKEYKDEVSRKIMKKLQSKSIPISEAGKYSDLIKMYESILDNSCSVIDEYLCKIYIPKSCSSNYFNSFTEKLRRENKDIFTKSLNKLQSKIEKIILIKYKELGEIEEILKLILNRNHLNK